MAQESLDDKVRHHPPIVRVHPRTISVKDPCDLYLQIVLPPIIEKEGLRAALSFIVAGAWPHRVDVPPIIFWLRMNVWVTVDF